MLNLLDGIFGLTQAHAGSLAIEFDGDNLLTLDNELLYLGQQCFFVPFTLQPTCSWERSSFVSAWKWRPTGSIQPEGQFHTFNRGFGVGQGGASVFAIDFDRVNLMPGLKQAGNVIPPDQAGVKFIKPGREVLASRKIGIIHDGPPFFKCIKAHTQQSNCSTSLLYVRT